MYSYLIPAEIRIQINIMATTKHKNTPFHFPKMLKTKDEIPISKNNIPKVNKAFGERTISPV